MFALSTTDLLNAEKKFLKGLIKVLKIMIKNNKHCMLHQVLQNGTTVNVQCCFEVTKYHCTMQVS